MNRRLGEPQSPNGRFWEQKNLFPLAEFESRIAQPLVQSLYQMSYNGT